MSSLTASPSSLSPNIPFGGPSLGNVGLSKSTITPSSPSPSSILNRSHCSIVGQSGMGGSGNGSGIPAIMEIREMTMPSYCPPPGPPPPVDKYWSHQHHNMIPPPHPPPTGPGRHSSVYPPVFYPPPQPPPSQVYPPPPSCNRNEGIASSGTSDWSCPPPPPPGSSHSSHADSYSHFLYSQYPSHNDLSNYLSIPSSCYDTDLLMSGIPMQIPSQYGTSSSSASALNPSDLTSVSYSSSSPALSFTQLNNYQPMLTAAAALSPSAASILGGHHEKLINEAIPPPSSPPPPPLPVSSSPTSTSIDSSSEEDEDEEDDNNATSLIDKRVLLPEGSGSLSLLSWCSLCKKPTSGGIQQPSQPPPSPQLSRILENIDDDELDISVCSGDIEIGGIEDEMIQQETESQLNSLKITFGDLARLTKLPVSVFLPIIEAEEEEDEPCQRDSLYDCGRDSYAMLCFNCQKLINEAESLEKQLTSVLNNLAQIARENNEEEINQSLQYRPKNNKSVQTQVDPNDKHVEGDKDDATTSNNASFRCILVSKHNSGHKRKSTMPTGRTDNIEATCLVLSTKGDFLCHECGRIFNCGRNLGKHIKRTHLKPNYSLEDGKSQTIICTREGCGKKCSDNSKLQSHLQSHSNDKQYFCKNCLRLFSNKSNLTAHLKVCQNQDNSKDSFEDEDNNYPKKTSPSSFSCENCGLAFRTEKRFKIHSKSHCGRSTSFKCDICSKLFSKPSELRTHQSIHLGVKPFPCDICGLAFSTKGNQRVHQRTHSLQKRFKCGQCGKGFTRNQTLQLHVTNSHKD